MQTHLMHLHLSRDSGRIAGVNTGAEVSDSVKLAWRALMTAKVNSWNALERELEDYGLGVSDFEVLDRLVEEPTHEIRLQDLAESVHLSQSALSRLADRLERHGLVSRCSCADDRRGIFVVLTEAGASRHAEADSVAREVLARTLPPRLIAAYESPAD
jgi:DNA-binding MarR family transcriptional regulator